MNRIFCLETEWNQSLHSLKNKSTVQSLLDFYKESMGVQYVFRQVAGAGDFDFYISHLFNASYDPYDVVYLCFHGMEGGITFADGSVYPLDNFAKEHNGIFSVRTVIFDCCETLRISPKKAKAIKRNTGARLIIGYTRSVDFISSFVFEFWLLNAISQHPDFGAKRLMDLAMTEMPVHTKSLGFITY